MNPESVRKILKEVVKYGPVIAGAAKAIYENTKGKFGENTKGDDSKSGVSLQELDRKINQLEQNDINQTKLLSDLAQQNDNLSKLAKVLSTRFLYAIIVAIISLIFSIYILVRIL